MNIRKAVFAALAGCTFGLASSGAMAVECSTINTIGAWEAAGSCDQGDKVWTFVDSNLLDSVQVLFGNPGGGSTHSMQIIGFDVSNLAGSWEIDYTIAVTDPAQFISDMFAGADNPGAGSTLNKDVTGDEVFSLSVINGVENAGSEAHGLNASFLSIHEEFTVDANNDLLSVSNTYRQSTLVIAEPGTVALMGIALAGLALIRRRYN
jgi:hypothetical protein